MIYSTRHYGEGDPNCKICHGCGYYTYEVPMDHPLFGKMQSCTCRGQISGGEAAVKAAAKSAGVTGEGWKLEREFWSLTGREELEQAVKEMADDFTKGGGFGWLTLVSNFGLGKSAMGEWLVIQAIRAGRKAVFASCDNFQEALACQIRGEDGLLTKLAQASVLVLDQPDWLYEKGGDSYQINQARVLLDRRYRLRDSLTTVMLLNLKAWQRRNESGLAAIYNRAEEGRVVVTHAAGVRSAIGQTVETKG